MMKKEKGLARDRKGLSAAATVLFLLPVLVLLAGCASSTAGIEGSASSMGPDQSGEISKYVVVNNPKLARGIQIVDLQTGYAGNLMKASISLVSKYSDTQDIKYKFSWYDADGVEIDPDSTPWIPLILYGNESKQIQGVAPNPAARKFLIKLRN